jgi:hypothetical protein
VVPDNVHALEWLRKHLEAEGSDLLREMVRTFAERLDGRRGGHAMQRHLRRGHTGAHEQPQRLSIPPARHPSGFDRTVDPEAARGELVPGLAVRDSGLLRRTATGENLVTGLAELGLPWCQ